jgi:SAM-dependent methyltransferase
LLQQFARRRRIRRESLVAIRPESGHAFTARTGRLELSAHEGSSPAVVLEDGRPLGGPANARHDDIRQAGGGRFSFWRDQVYFAASDNSDPRTNGRRYEIAFPIGAMRSAVLRVGDVVRSPRPAPARPAERVPGGYDADLLIRTWRRLGAELPSDATVLDFGCGGGERVQQLRRKGIAAFGCDITLSDDGEVRAAREAGVLRPIQRVPYRLPFGDASCDVVFSVTVFEHVMNYDAALAEIARVLKPGGLSVHVFPSRWKPIETHAFVPFASVCQSYWWLYLWALAGTRNEFQAGCSARQTARLNARFLREETNYLTQRQIHTMAGRYFGDCRFVEEALFKPDRYARFKRLGPLQPLWRRWVSETSVRVLVLKAPRHP